MYFSIRQITVEILFMFTTYLLKMNKLKRKYIFLIIKTLQTVIMNYNMKV